MATNKKKVFFWFFGYRFSSTFRVQSTERAEDDALFFSDVAFFVGTGFSEIPTRFSRGLTDAPSVRFVKCAVVIVGLLAVGNERLFRFDGCWLPLFCCFFLVRRPFFTTEKNMSVDRFRVAFDRYRTQFRRPKAKTKTAIKKQKKSSDAIQRPFSFLRPGHFRFSVAVLLGFFVVRVGFYVVVPSLLFLPRSLRCWFFSSLQRNASAKF